MEQQFFWEVSAVYILHPSADRPPVFPPPPGVGGRGVVVYQSGNPPAQHPPPPAADLPYCPALHTQGLEHDCLCLIACDMQ